MAVPQTAQSDFENLLGLLTTRQYLSPHEPVSQSLLQAVGDLAVCPNAIAQSLDRLGVDQTKSIGRLRRTELMQLARTIHRYWRAVEPSQHSA